METALAIVQLLVPPPRSRALFLWGSCSLPLETVRAFHRGGNGDKLSPSWTRGGKSSLP